MSVALVIAGQGLSIAVRGRLINQLSLEGRSSPRRNSIWFTLLTASGIIGLLIIRQVPSFSSRYQPGWQPLAQWLQQSEPLDREIPAFAPMAACGQIVMAVLPIMKGIETYRGCPLMIELCFALHSSGKRRRDWKFSQRKQGQTMMRPKSAMPPPQFRNTSQYSQLPEWDAYKYQNCSWSLKQVTAT